MSITPKEELSQYEPVGIKAQITVSVDERMPQRGEIFLWKSGVSGPHELHTFHSDAGYGAKTFTNYNDQDGSSLIVNYSGIIGVLIC